MASAIPTPGGAASAVIAAPDEIRRDARTSHPRGGRPPMQPLRRLRRHPWCHVEHRYGARAGRSSPGRALRPFAGRNLRHLYFSHGRTVDNLAVRHGAAAVPFCFCRRPPLGETRPGLFAGPEMGSGKEPRKPVPDMTGRLVRAKTQFLNPRTDTLSPPSNEVRSSSIAVFHTVRPTLPSLTS